MQRSTRVCVCAGVRAGLVVGALALGCSASPPQPTEAPQQADAPRVTVSSLPAGLYFRNGYVWCDECPEPRWAVVAGIFDDPEAARSSASAVRDRAPVQAGFPFVVHSDELAPAEGEGIVVVLGFFAHEEQAREAASPDDQVIALLDREAAYEVEARAYDDDTWWKRRFVVQLEGSDPIEAFDAKAIVAAEEILASGPWKSYEEYLERRAKVIAEIPVLCRVAPDRIFVADQKRSERDDMLGNPYDWQPVTCDDGRAAWVRHSDTRRHTIVLPTEEGPILEQIVLVECDSATRQRWAWLGTHRRREGSTRPTASGRC